MAVRAWPRILLGAFAGGFIAGAGQLGVAYGFGVLRWGRQYTAGNDNLWSGQLTWTAWIAAVAVVCGGWVGVRTAERLRRNLAVGGRGLAALASAAGAAVTVPLVMLPMRLEHVDIVAHPARIAAVAAGLGLAAGVVAAVAVISVPPVAGNVVTTVAWVWLAACISLARGDDAPRLAVLTVTSGRARGPLASLMLVMLVITVLVSVAIAAIARWGGANRVWVAASGVGGPGLIAVAYLIAGTGISGDHIDQILPYTSALVAVLVGAAASVVVAVVRRPTRPEPKEPMPVDPDLPTGPAEPTVSLPTPSGERTVQLAPVGSPSKPDRSVGSPSKAAGSRDKAVGSRDKPAAPHDNEYIDWVKGLGGDSSEGSRAGRRRTQPEERSEPADPDA
jgi:hypothetical protein